MLEATNERRPFHVMASDTWEELTAPIVAPRVYLKMDAQGYDMAGA